MAEKELLSLYPIILTHRNGLDIYLSVYKFFKADPKRSRSSDDITRIRSYHIRLVRFLRCR